MKSDHPQRSGSPRPGRVLAPGKAPQITRASTTLHSSGGDLGARRGAGRACSYPQGVPGRKPDMISSAVFR